MSEEKKHETINRNERYVAIGSFVSVILLVFVRIEKMLRNELNKIFISNTGIEYIEAEQMILSVVASSCLFLLGLCVVYIFF